MKRSFVRSWWLAAGEGSIWATHPNQGVVNRIDPASARVVARIPVTLGRLFGVAAHVHRIEQPSVTAAAAAAMSGVKAE